jgi:hypothetical protein
VANYRLVRMDAQVVVERAVWYGEEQQGAELRRCNPCSLSSRKASFKQTRARARTRTRT